MPAPLTVLDRPRAERVAEILLDYACAAKCPFCYNPPLTPELLSRKRSPQGVAELIFKLREQGHDGLWLTGGEVTQLPDLPKYLRLAKRLGYQLIQIGTNGLRTADARYARFLALAGLNYARVSIHGAKAQTHDRLLGVAGAFEKASRSLQTLRSAGVPVGVNFVLNRDNRGELRDFLKLCHGRWGTHDIDVLFPHYRGMMALNAETTGIRYRDIAESVSQAVLAVEPSRRPNLINFPPCTLSPELRPWLSDWRHGDGNDHSLLHPESSGIELGSMKAGQRRQGAGCRSCAVKTSCFGFESAYADIYGETEFRMAR